jgi:Fur family ferric uptake transcriptional regulator
VDSPHPSDPSTGLRSSLHQRGQRLTPQRRQVLDLFERMGEGLHLSAEEVHRRLDREEGRVSLATVYRSLRLLSSLGLLQELELPDGGRRFELASDAHPRHHHLVCVGCGRTTPFTLSPAAEPLQSALSPAPVCGWYCPNGVRFDWDGADW